MHIPAEVVSSTTSITPNALDWTLLITVLVISTLLDSFLNRGHKIVSSKSAGIQVLIWTGVAILFGVYLGFRFNWTAAGEFFAAYPTESSLSLDNLFVLQTILAGVLVIYRPALLTWAIVLAIGFRGVLLVSGTTLLEMFSWVELLFGGVLFLAAYQMLKSVRRHEEEVTPLEERRTYQFLRKVLPFTEQWHGLRLFIWRRGVVFTPATLVVGCIVSADLIFALDSIPAVLAITRHPYIACAAVMFAVINLKSLYVMYQWLADHFPRVNHVLVGVLFLIGAKLVAGYFDLFHVPPFVATAVVVTILASGVVWSEWENRRSRRLPQRQRELAHSSY